MISQEMRESFYEEGVLQLQSEIYSLCLICGVNPDTLSAKDGSIAWQPSGSSFGLRSSIEKRLRILLDTYQELL